MDTSYTYFQSQGQDISPIDIGFRKSIPGSTSHVGRIQGMSPIGFASGIVLGEWTDQWLRQAEGGVAFSKGGNETTIYDSKTKTLTIILFGLRFKHSTSF